jgi:molybdenum cofactor synthesis domain-containing protein
MHGFSARHTVQAALAWLDGQLHALQAETVPLRRAAGRVLAAPIVSGIDVPGFDRATMDGFAVVAAATEGASPYNRLTFRVVGDSFPGAPFDGTMTAGDAVRIMTGAPMPPGADAVVMVEETESAGDAVRVMTPVHPRQHIGRRAADIAAGQTVLAPGQLLNPSRVGAIAAIGAADVEVFAQPRVAVISTGNEVVDPGHPLAPGQIHDINRFTLGAVITEHGGTAVPLRTAADALDALEQAVVSAADTDVIVFSGGSSVGERDLVLDIMRRMGEVVFHGIAVKPGKPTAFGRIDRKPVLGMPGYPTSCLSNAYILLVPLLRRIARLPEHQPRRVRLPLARRVVSTAGRHQFYTVRIDNGAAVPAFKASGDITSMSQADGYIEIPTHTDIVAEGDLVDVTLF